MADEMVAEIDREIINDFLSPTAIYAKRGYGFQACP
jgi:hypothetical protein